MDLDVLGPLLEPHPGTWALREARGYQCVKKGLGVSRLRLRAASPPGKWAEGGCRGRSGRAGRRATFSYGPFPERPPGDQGLAWSHSQNPETPPTPGPTKQ